MAELVINWNPLVRRDFDGFRRLALDVEGREEREKALLKAGGVIDALMGEIIRAGYFTDADTFAYAGEKYRKACEEGLEMELRKRLFQEVTAFTQHFDDCTATAYLPFICDEEDKGIVSTATLDYVSVGKVAEGADPLLLPRHLVQMLGSQHINNRGAVFGGLLTTGDPRVCELLWDIRSTLTEEEINEACLCHSGFIGAATVEFYLGWLEEIVHSERNSLFGKLASGLALIRRNVQNDLVFTGLRPFPYKSLEGDALKDCLKPVLLDDYTREIGPRMLKLTADDAQPKVMPDVLSIWGICNSTDAKGILITDDLAERCWEVLNDESLLTEDRYGILSRLIDIGIARGGSVITKVADSIYRKGETRIWEIVHVRYELSLEHREHKTQNGDVWGQIVAMPIICSTDIPDAKIPELCLGLPELPSGEKFKFVLTTFRWGDLYSNESINRLLHTMLFRWQTGDTPDVVERDMATVPPLNDTKSALDEIVVTRDLTLKLRFLVGYQLANADGDEVSNEQKNSWISSAQSWIDEHNFAANFYVRYPSPLVPALYAGQSTMMFYSVYANFVATESMHPLRDAEKFGVRIECFGDPSSQLASWFTVTSYDLENGDSIAYRDIPIALASTTSRWALEIDQLRVRAERAGHPFAVSAPILQPTQMHPAVFEKTKCIKITLGAPVQFEKQYTDTLSLDPETHLPEEKERWALELDILPLDADIFQASVAAALGVATKDLYVWGTYTVEGERWLPTVVLPFDGVKCENGSELNWPPEKSVLEAAIAFATTNASRKWSNYQVGGLGGEVSHTEKSVEKILAEARSGDLASQLSMAAMLYEGKRVPVDLTTSLQWYRAAGQKGHAGAQAMVAYMLEEGMGCDKSDSEAFLWFRLGAENGDAYCQYKLAVALEAGLHIQKNMSDALKWYRKAAEQGDTDAQCELGIKLYWGDHAPKDLKEAAAFFERAARKGNAAAQYNIGAMLAHGEHAEVDRVAAAAWLRLAAEQDYDGAEDGLAQISGEMTAKEIEQAKALAQNLCRGG
ncbi:tetratricopeptide repeat protein [Novosphingobium sp. AAP83]|uniref:tetratricopeptide repeat protein n=1 Tax=Novosphingobium sp. AAP83 TaxID=1523425 RepID=UPI0006B9AF88|nr:tetratricopeptide repeat protein [Novosphingobium sp. AAP83]